MRLPEQPVYDEGLCPHCLHKTKQRVVCVHERGHISNDEYIDIFVLLVCEQCKGALLYDSILGRSEMRKEEWDASMNHLLDPLGILWPVRVPLAGVPYSVSGCYWKGKRFEKAHPEYYALEIRKALEAICDDKGVSGRGLRERLKRLVAEGYLQPIHFQLLDEILPLLNKAAHDPTYRGDYNWVLDKVFYIVVDSVYSTSWFLRNLRAKLRGEDLGIDDDDFMDYVCS
jgi:hypothetical protein